MKYADNNDQLHNDHFENVNGKSEESVGATGDNAKEKTSLDSNSDEKQDISDLSERKMQGLKADERQDEQPSKEENRDEGPTEPEYTKHNEEESESSEGRPKHNEDEPVTDESQEHQEDEAQNPEVTEPKEEVQKANQVAAEGEPEKSQAKEDEQVENIGTAEKKEHEKPESKEEEKINYALLSKSDLVKILEDLLNKKSFQEMRSSVKEIQVFYTSKQEAELIEKRERFIAEGGLEQDFKPAEDPIDKKMEELVGRYKALKADYNKKLEDEKEANLKIKQEILEEFRLLMEQQESFDYTFRKFKQLQKRWFNVGIVPRQNVRDLWNSYNFFVDKFNDYVNISKELKVLDLKKNLEKKTEVGIKAEALVNESNISSAFKTLQTYHAQWRNIGPVPRDDKDVIWERFREATAVINKAHQQFQARIKESLFENLELKKALCEKAEAIAALGLSEHREWEKKTRELLKIQKEWKTIGYAPKRENNKIYSRFRKACDEFFRKKAAFYAENMEQQKEIIQRKKEIVAAAEELKDSTDWKPTTHKLIDLQKQWKESGSLPRKESDKLWFRFRSACDHFFNNKSEFYGGKKESFKENLKKKEALIKEIKTVVPPGDTDELAVLTEKFQERYDEIGFVPIEDKDRIRDEFRDAVGSLVNKIDTDEHTKALIQYKVKISAIANGPRGDTKLRFERDKVMDKLQQLRNDIGVWENNIGFFKQTKSAEETISDFQEKIDNAHARIKLLEKKIRIIDQSEGI